MARVTRRRLTAAALSLSVTLACSSDPTQLVVVVDSDLETPSPLSRVRAEIRDHEGRLIGRYDFAMEGAAGSAEVVQYNLPLSFGVLPPAQDFERRVSIEVSALSAAATSSAAAPLFTHRATTRFVKNRSLRLPMFLAARCQASSCGPDQTCTAQGCVSAIVDETTLTDSPPTEAEQTIELGPGYHAPPTRGDAGIADRGVPPGPGPQPDAGFAPRPDAGFASRGCQPGELFGQTCFPILPTYVDDCYSEGTRFDCRTLGSAAGSASCSATPFCGQDAQYPPLTHQRFACVSAAGQDLPSCPREESPGESVRDLTTGLQWQRADVRKGLSWQEAVDHCATLNAGGHSDWRLPRDPHELRTIMNHALNKPALDERFFPNWEIGSSWTSLERSSLSSEAWMVSYEGLVRSTGKTQSLSLKITRCVRGGTTERRPPTPRFTQSTSAGDVVVLDMLTGLMWQHAFREDVTWQQALAHCEGLSYGGHDDWRLPNLNALASLLDFGRQAPATELPDARSATFWSSTTSARNRHYAWEVGFSRARVWDGIKSTDNWVRCVR